jgi:nicotinate-nucleotide adenylyltransferase
MADPAKQQFPFRRVAIFGGSFDPVHRGHLAMATLARAVAGLEEVLFMPAAVSPFKQGTVATAAQRFEMLGIALADAAMDWAGVSDFELKRPAPSYSWETLRHFRVLEPETEWYWILGTDQWEQIDRWAEPERLREGLHFLVFTREGQIVRDRPGWRRTAIPFEHPASSTAIRADFAAHRDWLTEGVVAYCGQERIYGSL